MLRGWQQIEAWWDALTIAASKIPNLSASKITSGMLNFASFAVGDVDRSGTCEATLATTTLS